MVDVDWFLLACVLCGMSGGMVFSLLMWMFFRSRLNDLHKELGHYDSYKAYLDIEKDITNIYQELKQVHGDIYEIHAESLLQNQPSLRSVNKSH